MVIIHSNPENPGILSAMNLHILHLLSCSRLGEHHVRVRRPGQARGRGPRADIHRGVPHQDQPMGPVQPLLGRRHRPRRGIRTAPRYAVYSFNIRKRSTKVNVHSSTGLG